MSSPKSLELDFDYEQNVENKMWLKEQDYLSVKLNGFFCSILRNRNLLFLTGYVHGIPAGILYAKDILDIHGGISYCEKDKSKSETYTFGIDFAHAGDYVPGDALIGISIPVPVSYTYKGLLFVQRELNRMTKQLRELLEPEGTWEPLPDCS